MNTIQNYTEIAGAKSESTEIKHRPLLTHSIDLLNGSSLRRNVFIHDGNCYGKMQASMMVKSALARGEVVIVHGHYELA